ncbi:MAG: MFS transporter [Microbacteriaceae bacterium]|nr:MFS transporter [Cryobacterium sp.]MBX3103361.1 MFS transporter [Cryobacterium sp.]MCC6375989.1 MFS transporter [Microbacteriaceae bacterium]
MPNSLPQFKLGSIVIPALLPALAFSIGEGAVIPIIPIVAHNLGAQLAIAGLIAAMLSVGELIGDIPSGWVVSRIGERAGMIWSALLAIIALTVAYFSRNEWLLGVAVLLIGVSTAIFALARHAFLTSFVPIEFRARALSTLGGSFRLGLLIGPFVAAGVIHLTGTTETAFLVHIGGCLVAIGLLVFIPEPSATFNRSESSSEAAPHPERNGLLATLRRNRKVLVRLGTGAAIIGALRSSRQVVIPLWAVSIGLSDTQTALLVGVAAALDFALFYTTGQIMDRWGRMWTAMPSMIGLGLGHLALAASIQLPAQVTWLVACTMILALANGFGAGLLMTMGADLADKRDPAPFLGAWRFTGDLGRASAPLAISAITALSSLSLAVGAMGILGLIGAGILGRYIPRFVGHLKSPEQEPK